MSSRAVLEGKSLDRPDLSLPTLDGEPTPPRKRPNYARWRAFSLSMVYVLFGLHIAHWKITGRTLAPLELNEVMYTLELGIITAGFIFMCVLVLGSFVFGRFFCSWACHIMVLQDLCGWLLRRLHIRPKQVRSRLLLFIPPLTALYMFVWPQLVRTWQAKALPTFHFAGDAEGWASFATTNFWRNLPGPWIMGLTFLICGFAIVYILGSRSFCTYVCPYGAVFGLADRFSFARIRVNDSCKQCGRCTAACTSSVRVHDEVRKHGMIVNPACLKDLDCVAACPQGALSYGLGKPALFRSWRSGGRFGVPYDFTLTEELLAAGVFLASVLCLRGLYGRIPFLLALGCGVIAGYGVVVLLRLATHADLTFARAMLKRRGRVRPGGYAYLAGATIALSFLVHSGLIRYHEYQGLRNVRLLQAAPDARGATLAGQAARRQLGMANRWGLFANPNVERGLFTVAVVTGDAETAAAFADGLLARRPDDAYTRIALARTFVAAQKPADAEAQLRHVVGDCDVANPKQRPALIDALELLGDLAVERRHFGEAVDAFRRSLDVDPESPARRAKLGAALAEIGRIDEAVVELELALSGNPSLHRAGYNLGTLLMYAGRFSEAAPYLERAIAAFDTDPDAHNNLGLALLNSGTLDRSETHLRRAIDLAPDHAAAHFNLARVLARTQRYPQAEKHLRRAAALDPNYRRVLSGESG